MRYWASFAVVVFILLTGAGAAASSAGSVWQDMKPAWSLLTPDERQAVFAFNEGYKDCLWTARTGWTSTREMIRQAAKAGFVEFTEPSQVKPGARLLVNNRDRALALIVVGSERVRRGTRLIGTHHDAPRIDVKARPAVESHGFLLFKTIHRGGIKKYQWANIPLMLSGRIATKDGRVLDVSIGGEPGDPVFLIPDVAPHVDKPMRDRPYTDVLKGEELNPVMGSVPDAEGSVFRGALGALLDRLRITEEDLVSADLAFLPAYPPRDEGLDRGLTAAYGQDDMVSTYVTARAILDLAGTPRLTAIAYLTDNEETGSNNNTGAFSRFIWTVYRRLLSAQGGVPAAESDMDEALKHTIMVSADSTDGLNPIFPEVSEPANVARLGYGVAIKRYGRGTDPGPEVLAKIRSLLDGNRIPWQTGTYKVDVGGGQSIGGFFSLNDMEVVDIGIPLLSMHAPYELSSKVDVWYLYRFAAAFFKAGE